MTIPSTQSEAFHSITNKEAKQLLVLTCIRQCGNATLFELVKLLGWPVNRISGRITELKDSGDIVDTGKNPESQKSGIVWRAA